MSRSQTLVQAREGTLLDLADRPIDHGGILAGNITIAVAESTWGSRSCSPRSSASRSPARSGRGPWTARGARISR
jgi:hypothetical protein